MKCSAGETYFDLVFVLVCVYVHSKIRFWFEGRGGGGVEVCSTSAQSYGMGWDGMKGRRRWGDVEEGYG